MPSTELVFRHDAYAKSCEARVVSADLGDIGYVCTAGGAMVRFLSGKKLPLVLAMERAFERDSR